jgi:hypothetical protein
MRRPWCAAGTRLSPARILLPILVLGRHVMCVSGAASPQCGCAPETNRSAPGASCENAVLIADVDVDPEGAPIVYTISETGASPGARASPEAQVTCADLLRTWRSHVCRTIPVVTIGRSTSFSGNESIPNDPSTCSTTFFTGIGPVYWLKIAGSKYANPASHKVSTPRKP